MNICTATPEATLRILHVNLFPSVPFVLNKSWFQGYARMQLYLCVQSDSCKHDIALNFAAVKLV